MVSSPSNEVEKLRLSLAERLRDIRDLEQSLAEAEDRQASQISSLAGREPPQAASLSPEKPATGLLRLHRAAAAALKGFGIRPGQRGAGDVEALRPLFDSVWYLAKYPEVTATGLDPVIHYLEIGARAGHRPNPLFDGSWYLARYPDVKQAGLNPLGHFLSCGAAEGRDPMPLFDTAGYLLAYPDVRAAGFNPLDHYLRVGGPEGRRPCRWFDARWYLSCHPDVGAAGLNPLVHYIEAGAAVGFQPNPLFDPQWYLSMNPDVTAKGGDPLIHYVETGEAEGRRPHPLFDPDYYRSREPQITADQSPLLHFLTVGGLEGRSPHPLFDSAYYLARNPEVAASGHNPLVDFLQSGAQEGRHPSPLFDPVFYLRESPEAAASGLNPLCHYVVGGFRSSARVHPLFDPEFYRQRYPDVAESGGNPLEHYVLSGGLEGRSPHPLFDGFYYLENNPEVAASGQNPLRHFLETGAATGRAPCPLFDPAFYLRTYPHVAEAGLNPLIHFSETGAAEGYNPHPLFETSFYVAAHADARKSPLAQYLEHGHRPGHKPSPLFDADFYLRENHDVAAARINPLMHYLAHGARDGRDPNPYFDTRWYLRSYQDAAMEGVDPLLHYLSTGAREGNDPSALFDTNFYLASNPDVVAAGLNPLYHFLAWGQREGRLPRAAEVPTQRGYTPPQGLLPWFNPLNLRAAPELRGQPCLNVLVPGLAMKHMSGGPNTAVVLAYRLAELGVPVRLIGTDAPLDADDGPFWRHVQNISEVPCRLNGVELRDASDRSRPLAIGENDLFMATAWWTAQMAKYAIRHTRHSRFVYLIQDYEPVFHAASTQYALAQETYRLDHLGIINSESLKAFLVERGIGRYADPGFVSEAMVFSPCVDRNRFYPPADRQRPKRRQLLFYARPTNGLRNLFEMGVAALQKAIFDRVLDPEEWDFVGMGEQFAPVELGRGAALRPAPWLDFDGYAKQMRESDLLLSPMLSPHPSYPPLEMAACGGFVVTTEFANKTAAHLASISPRILATEATIEGLTDGIARALELRRQAASTSDPVPDLGLPQTWRESLSDVVPELRNRLLSWLGAPRLSQEARVPGEAAGPFFPGYSKWPEDDYENRRFETLRERSVEPTRSRPELISLVTTVWNTDPAFLKPLAETVFGQDCGPGFEWLVLDNGSTREDTRRLLKAIAGHPAVRLHRVEENLGIVRGMRHCLERATRRYVVPMDSDDLLTPDAISIVTRALVEAEYPPLAYTDEDKILGDRFRDPYFKPDFDPVLFVNSCYIAHLGCIERERALELGAYDDPETDGSHDWDTFMRFFRAGIEPLHIPHVVYTWRMHPDSTAGNIHSKSYVMSSQVKVLEKFLAGHPQGGYRLEPSPFFAGTPDWWIRRRTDLPWPITTVWLEAPRRPLPPLGIDPTVPHHGVAVPSGPDWVLRLRDIARSCAAEGRLVHLLGPSTHVDGPDWALEAMATFELFRDAMMIGGRLHRDGRITAAGSYFGFGRGCDSPDVGRALTDSGYVVQMFKPHTVSAVPVHHSVCRGDFLSEALERLASAPGISVAHLGRWLGAAARDRGGRIVYSPFFSARVDTDPEEGIGEGERMAFRSVYRHLLPETRLLSSHLGLRPQTAYQGVSPADRRAELDALEATHPSEYSESFAADVITRRLLSPPPPIDARLSLLSAVYEKTLVADFREIVRSVQEQTLPYFEWILLDNGPIPSDLDQVVQDLASRDSRVRRIRCERNQGIPGGLRLCLEAATGDFVVPIGADDVLTPDALQLLAEILGSTDAAFAYTDEDVLRDDRLEFRLRRTDFDPIRNATDSYIWHLCTFRRERARSLDVFGDRDAEHCHAWDTVRRFEMAGDRIAHAPHVAYHWRVAGDAGDPRSHNPGSIAAVTRQLRSRIVGLAHPERYEVAPHPISRPPGALTILRRPIDLPRIASVCVVSRGLDGWAELRNALGSVESDIVRVFGSDLLPPAHPSDLEAVRLFEMHKDVSLVSGRILDLGKRVVDAVLPLSEPDGSALPWRGLDRADPGTSFTALKAQSGRSVPDRFFYAETGVLRQALSAVSDESVIRSGIGRALGGFVLQAGRRIGYSPLVEAVIGYSADRAGGAGEAATTTVEPVTSR